MSESSDTEIRCYCLQSNILSSRLLASLLDFFLIPSQYLICKTGSAIHSPSLKLEYIKILKHKLTV